MESPEPTARVRRVALVGAECEESLPLRYLHASLKQAGYDVLLIPFNREADLQSAARDLASSGAELAGLSMVFTARAREFAALAARARELGYAGHIVAGGHFAAFNAEALLQDVPAIDSVAIGEGERLICELAARLDRMDSVQGLVRRDANGRIVRNPPAPPIPELDALPPPVRLTPPDRYLGMPIANMLSSRGCTHACYFCSIAAWHKLCGGRRFRMRSPGNVADELAALYADGYRIFNFHDDNFLLGTADRNLARIQALSLAIERRKVGRFAFAVKSRPDAVNDRVFGCLRSMGLFRVFVGIEAGTDEALRNLGRRQTAAQNERALDILNRLDLHVCFNLLMFNPDSTLEDFRRNVEFLRAHPANPMNFCRAEVYAGTPLEQSLRRNGRLEGSHWGYGYHMRDDRAQRAFELMHRLLFDRHHSDENLHHLTMRVDYERQLLDYFFRCPDDLRSRAKDFVRRVNQRSAEFLLRIATLAEQGPGVSENAIAELRRDIEADTKNLTQEGADLLAHIRRSAWDEARSGRTATLARIGVAASLILTTGTGAAGQHMHEMVAVPLEAPANPEGGSTTNAPARPGQPPDGDFNRLQNNLGQIIPVLIRHMEKSQDVDLEIWLDNEGKTSFAAVYQAGRAKDAKIGELSKEDKERAGKLLKDLNAAAFAAREKATRELKQMGTAVLPLVRAHKKQQTDPEATERCNQIIEAVDILAKARNYIQMIRDIKDIRVSVSSDDYGKRYVGAINANTMEMWRRRGVMNRPHVFEMAPVPRD